MGLSKSFPPICRGDPIPVALIEKVSEYLPDNLAKLLFVSEVGFGVLFIPPKIFTLILTIYTLIVDFTLIKDTVGVDKSCTWIHSDIMDDNIHMELSCLTSCSAENSNLTNGDHSEQKSSWFATHILDFSNLSIGEF